MCKFWNVGRPYLRTPLPPACLIAGTRVENCTFGPGSMPPLNNRITAHIGRGAGTCPHRSITGPTRKKGTSRDQKVLMESFLWPSLSLNGSSTWSLLVLWGKSCPRLQHSTYHFWLTVIWPSHLKRAKNRCSNLTHKRSMSHYKRGVRGSMNVHLWVRAWYKRQHLIVMK